MLCSEMWLWRMASQQCLFSHMPTALQDRLLSFLFTVSQSSGEVGASLQVALPSDSPELPRCCKISPQTLLHSPCAFSALTVWAMKGPKTNSRRLKMRPWEPAFLARAFRSRGWITSLHPLGPPGWRTAVLFFLKYNSFIKKTRLSGRVLLWCWCRWIPEGRRKDVEANMVTIKPLYRGRARPTAVFEKNKVTPPYLFIYFCKGKSSRWYQGEGCETCSEAGV